MAKKKKKRGFKSYRPHSVVTFLYGLLGLGVVGALAAFVFMPMFTCSKDGSVFLTFSGLEFVQFGLRQFVAAFNSEKFAAFTSYYANAEATNELLKTIVSVHGYVEIGVTAFFAIALFWAIIELLLALIFAAFGKSNHPKGVDIFGWLVFWFFAIYIGLSFMYFFFYMQIIESAGEKVSIDLTMESLIILGIMLVLCVILSIVYTLCLKDRIPLDKGKRKAHKHHQFTDEDDEEEEEKEEKESVSPLVSQPLVTSNHESQPQPQPQNVPEPQLNVTPQGSDVITVGDRAYAKNTELTTAVIPEGIVSLGSSAFANCLNLTSVTLPASLQEIGFNCFFNTPNLKTIIYNGPIDHWKLIKRGSNWLTKSGTKTVQCENGQINVNPKS